MAIIFPASCRGTTAGALRQVKEQGWSTASAGVNKDGGGLMSAEYVNNLVFQLKGFTRESEPLGIFMSQLTEAKKTVEETTEAVSSATRAMVQSARDASDQMTDASRKMRDATEKLTSQMQKFHTLFASARFAEQAGAAQSLADAMERLSKLQEAGRLDKVMQAMR